MINALHLLWIVPLSGSIGAFWMAVLAGRRLCHECEYGDCVSNEGPCNHCEHGNMYHPKEEWL